MLNRDLCCPEQTEQKDDEQRQAGKQHDITRCRVISLAEGYTGIGGVYADKPGETQAGGKTVKQRACNNGQHHSEHNLSLCHFSSVQCMPVKSVR